MWSTESIPIIFGIFWGWVSIHPLWKFYGNSWVEFCENDHCVRKFSRKVHIISRNPVEFPNCSVDLSIQTLERVLYVIYREYSDNFWYTLRLGIYPRDVKVFMEIPGLSFEKTIILFASFREKYTLFPVYQ